MRFVFDRLALPSLPVEAPSVVVSGPDCSYDPFAGQQATTCGQLMDYLTKKGITYTQEVTPSASVGWMTSVGSM